uniref:ADAM metallopeptidase with thrombospondin type 1 motif 7 n=1 Tax=Chrysemys picta bellii TaxID=8478 RepID=A0A8C3IQV8_CHRPI
SDPRAVPSMSAPLRRLLLLAGALALAGCAEQPGGAQYSGYDVVHPVRVDESGSFLSYDLAHRAIHKRALSSRNNLLSFYELHYKGQHLKFNLSVNNNLLAPGFVSERRYGGITNAKIQSYNHNFCHMIGEVQNWALKGGLAALSTCDGLRGVFRLANEDYFIEPLATNKHEDGTAHPHRIYKRHAPKYEEEEKQPDTLGTCGQSLETSEKRRERWEQKQQRKRRIKQRSISKEKWVETLVVADTKMVEYHGSENIEKYVLTVMNMVAGIFHDASIGNPINIAIVRLILLEDDEEDLKITHHADNTLKSFCKWQKSINVKGDAHPLHHDVAVLLTRKDICAAMNRPCETLGLSHVSGMCQPHRSCNINEDTGLPLAFTVAHELGHSFGIQHDGSGNDCEPVGKRPFIMSPQLLYDTSPLTWSRCSREYVTRFLDRGWGLCLDDPPAKEVVDYPLVPPGVLYDVSHQCRLQYGAYSAFCDDMDNVCNTLWCSVGNTCHSKLDAAVDGTKCGENKWCFNGECVQVGYRPDAIDGGWGTWSSWSICSRTCGAGVQNAERQCNNPTPKYGGKYCLGERKRFRVCNMKPCPTDKPSFRHIQCSQFDAMLYKGKLYKWTPVPTNINPCELHCRPEDEYFSEKLRDAVIDGTPCYEGNASRDICINGICKNVGCDYEIDSNAVEDRCGVCHGDGSTCQTVKKMFEESEGLGYVDIGMIPAGAREIRIEEVAEAGNFLALRSEDPEKYFLNGGWTIQWNGDYKVAGTTFTYERTGNWENLTSPGPTGEPVWIQLLFQETNPGVRYQYTIRRESDQENEIQPAEFFWRYGSWTNCTATCGTGVQRQIVHCVEKMAGIVEERYCDSLTRPDDKQRTCSEEPCPARWWVGEWQKCSATCGEAGLTKRTVLCIQSVWLDEQRALQHTECQHLSKPDATAPCNRDILCPAQWAMGNWSECSVTCGNGTQRRLVYCSNNTRTTCDLTQRPLSETTCSLKQCQKKIENANTDWSGSGSSSRELFNEINYIPNHHISHFSPSIPNNPKSKDENVITEEDFSSSSNKKGNVFVDDFYYDYNFINFHEDLSYDPLGEKDIKSEGADMNGPPHNLPPQPTTNEPLHPAAKDTPFLSTEHRSELETRGTRGDTHPTMGSYKSDNKEPDDHVSRAEDVQKQQDDFNAVSQTHETQAATMTTLAPLRSTPPPGHEPPTQESRTLTSNSLAQQGARAPAVPVSSDPNPTAGPEGTLSALPAELTTARWAEREANEIKTTHYRKDVFSDVPGATRAGPNESAGPDESSPWGTQRIFTNQDFPMKTSCLLCCPCSSLLPDCWALVSVAGCRQGLIFALLLTVFQCSTTCGLGASWRTVHCSTGKDEDCVAAKKPVPARRCYLRPCSSWRIGNWSKCSKNCGGGLKVRDVHCVDTREQRLLRPFHCQAVFYKPPMQTPCQTKPCLDWYTSSWRECSESCGSGEQERLVTCPEFGRCDEMLRPNNTRPCNTHPCTKWVVGSWGECTATCGGGIQRRQVKCMNTKTGEAEEDSSLCDHEQWPENTQKCNPQDCDNSESTFICERDRLTFSFCQTLRILGRCHLPTVNVQCCRTCRQHGHSARDRGNERVSRR